MAKKVAVFRKTRILHLGFDPVAKPWSGALVRMMSGHHKFGHVEHHAPDPGDEIAARYQFYRPEFPDLDGSTGPGKLNRMARAMRKYELVIVHGEAGFPATMAHSLFGEALKLPPLVHYHDSLSGFAGGPMKRFRHKLGFARTSAVIAPAPAAANEMASRWALGGGRLRIAVPPFPAKPPAQKPDAIPQMMKRKGESWIGVRAALLLRDPQPLLRAMLRVDEHWRLVVFGTKEECLAVSSAADVEQVADRVMTSTRLSGPEDRAGLFDIIAIAGPAPGALIPPALFHAAAAGVPLLVEGRELNPLLPAKASDLAVASGGRKDLADAMVDLATSEVKRKGVARAMEEFAATHAKGAEHLALFSELTGDERIVC
ncbi:glycosyltransferase [Croceicoccus mobilis]|uniref:Glycosyltransferase subfamily 4-like N-terminal domain-containing protein n=1 Tax=Croceicoccus mobilis TaxID=1703339 RepID=A0A916YZA5_9SPHN|nr:glycosyltransferase [Croceicoccus mobilis]GGD68679.1 hypothetical protein GCM10010990_17790 [Croceicoccus mobilis]